MGLSQTFPPQQDQQGKPVSFLVFLSPHWLVVATLHLMQFNYVCVHFSPLSVLPPWLCEKGIRGWIHISPVLIKGGFFPFRSCSVGGQTLGTLTLVLHHVKSSHPPQVKTCLLSMSLCCVWHERLLPKKMKITEETGKCSFGELIQRRFHFIPPPWGTEN